MLTVPPTAHSMEETSAIAQYYTLAKATRRSEQKEEQIKNENSPLKPKNSINIVLSSETSDTKGLSKQIRNGDVQKSSDSPLGKNLDLVF